MSDHPHSDTVGAKRGGCWLRFCLVVALAPFVLLASFALTRWAFGYDPPLRLLPFGGSLIVVTSDGQQLVIPAGQVMFRSLSDGRRVRAISDPQALNVALSPDGQILATGGADHMLRVWRISDGSLVRTLDGHGEAVTAVAFSPDGQTLASGDGRGMVRLWHSQDGQLRHLLDVGREAPGVQRLAFSPDGRLLGVAARHFSLWQVSDWQLVRTFDGGDPIFSPDGQLLALGPTLWQISDGRKVRRLPTQAGGIVAFSPDGQLLALGRACCERRLIALPYLLRTKIPIELRRVSDGQLVQTLAGHTDGLVDLAFSRDGQLLISSSGDGLIGIWQVGSSQPQRLLVFSAVVVLAGASSAFAWWRWRKRRRRPRG